MSWYRLEPNTVDTDVEEGTQARIADPLWLLARQWQLGEFKGEDAASPIHVSAELVAHTVSTFRNDATPGSPTEPLAHDAVLEARVEAEHVEDGPAAIALAAEAGLQFLRRLDLSGLGDVRSGVDWAAHVGFDLDAEGIELVHLPERTARRLRLLAHRGVDGRKVLAAGKAGIWRVARTAPGAVQRTVDQVWDAWQAEYEGRLQVPGRSGPCWVEERMEYAFSVGVRTGQGEVVLSANEYRGGHLDWHSFRIDERATHGLTARAATPETLHRLPQPARFRGQGAPRWWEFEDRAVYFGNLSAGPADVARLVVAEYGAVFSDDWFLIPVTVPVGSLSRVRSVVVHDVFGGDTPIAATAVNDHAAYGGNRPFRLFELEGDTSVTQTPPRNPWLFIPPPLADQQHGRPVEHVTMLRDEQANLGWAIEHRVELPTGDSMRRRAQWVPGQDEASDIPARNGGSAAWRYRLQMPVPPWWIPLVPDRVHPGRPEVRLRRSRLSSWADTDPALRGAKGRIIGAPRALFIHEEEVPRGGVQVTRGWQRARAADGSVRLWMARRKRPGRGDRGSGLEFDVIDRSDSGER